MKKLLIICLALALLLSLAACGGKNTVNSNNTAAGNTAAAGDQTANEPQTEPEEEVEQEPEQEVESDEPADSGEADPETDGEEGSVDEEQDEETEQEETVVITASHSDVTLKAAGDSFELKPKGTDDTYTVLYTSADESIAVVDAGGKVTAVAPGTTTITMQVEGNEFTCIVRCSWTVESEEDSSETPSAGVDLAAFFMSFMEGLGNNAPFMMAAEGEILDAYYAGLSSISCKQCVVQMAGISSVPFEFALVEVENAADVEAVVEILQSRVDYQVDGGAWYPETIEGWEKAEIVVIGNYVAMIVAGDQQSAAVDAFNALFN